MADEFTEEEVRGAVDKFLLRELSVGQLSSGARDVLSMRNAAYDLVTTALLLRPDAFLYVVWLASNKLKGLISKQVADLQTIDDSGAGVTRPSKKITSTAELTNARSALLEVGAGLSSRSVGVRGSIGPAVDRFRRSVSRFLDEEVTKNVVVGGEVTDTAEGLRSTIRTAWAAVVTRHEEIVTLAQNILGALDALDRVNLPATALRSITSRMQTRLEELEEVMAGSQGIQESRQALLDLLTMRTLLSRSASFRTPALRLAPLTGDGSVASMISSPGTEARVVGNVSGPYNYAPGSTLDLSINTAASTPSIPLPGHSRAELRSRTFSPWVSNGGGEEAAFTVNYPASPATVFTGGLPVLTSGPNAVIVLGPLLTPDIVVSWDAAKSQLVFQSANTTDISRIVALTDSTPRADFVAWLLDGGLLEGRPTPPTAKDVVAAVAAASPLVNPEISEIQLGSFNGVRDALPADTIWNRVDEGVNLAVNATDVVTSPTKNFEGLGIKVGMGLEILSPPANVGQFLITAISGGALTLDASVPGPAGAVTYRIGPDYRGVPDGARVQVTSRGVPDNTGFYRVAVGGGSIASIQVDRNLAAQDDTLSVRVFTQFLSLTARGTTTTSGIAVTNANSLGFAVGPEVRPSLTTFQVVGASDFFVRGIRAGDQVILTSPTSVVYTRFVESITATRVTVTSPVPYEAGSWSFRIESIRVSRYTTLTGPPGVSTFLSSPYVVDFAELDALLGRLINGGRYAGQIQTAVQQYVTDLSSLSQALAAYAVPKETSIDSTIRMMREQGMDRAADLFLSLEIDEFFSMDPEGVSYSTWAVFQSARAARNIAPVSKLAKGPAIQPEWRPLSFQLNPLDLRARDDG